VLGILKVQKKWAVAKKDVQESQSTQ